MNEPVNPKPEAQGLVAVPTGTTASVRSVAKGEGQRIGLKPETARDYLPILSNRYRAKSGDGKVIPSAFEFINNSMGGWRTGMHLLAGEPGSGKTAFALFNAAVAAEAGFPVLYLSFDVQSEFLTLKLLCQQENLNCRDVMDGSVDPAALKAAMTAQEDTFSRVTLVEADPELSNEKAEEMARRLIMDSDHDRALVIVDYLQIWAAGSRQFSEFRHEIAKMMTAMRRLAISLDSPVLAISSQNRAHQGEAVLQSLEGTSDLEYSADSIAFLVNVERPASQGSYTHPDDLISKSRSVSLNLRKNRFGETGSRMVKFLPATGAYDEETVRRPYGR